MLIKILINSLIGLVLIVVWLHFVDINQILKTLSAINIYYLTPVFIFMAISPIIRAFRLKIFLSKVAKISLRDLVYLNGVAMMLNFFIPIRGGEIAKGFYLGQNYHLHVGKSLIWIFLDRFIDFLVVLLASTILILVIPTNLPANFQPIILSLVSFLLILTYLMVYQVSWAEQLFKLLTKLLIFKVLQRLFERINSFLIESFTILKRPFLEILVLFLISVLAYMVDGTIWYFTFQALGIKEIFSRMLLGQMLSALTYLIPAAPGYVGSAEASGLLVLSGVLGVGINLASAMIVLFHICSALFVIVYGMISLFLLKMDLGLIFQKIFRR